MEHHARSRRPRRTAPAFDWRGAAAATAIGAGVVLGEFAPWAAPWGDVVRPIGVIALIATGLAAVSARLLPPFAATALTVLVPTAMLRPELAAIVAGVLIAWVAARRGAFLVFRLGDGTVGRATGLVAFGLLFAAVNLVDALRYQGIPGALRGPAAAAAATGDNASRSLYVLFLDGYPRQDSLMADFGYDNEPFLSALEERGFTVDRRSEALYFWTPQAVAHLLGVEEIPDRSGTAAWRHLRPLIERAPIVDSWSAAGYDVTFIRSPMSHVSPEWAHDTGQLTELEVVILGKSLLAGPSAAWVMDQQWERIDASLAAVVDRAGPSQLVIAHLMAPHPPFRAGPPHCWPADCTLWHVPDVEVEIDRETYSDIWSEQLAYLNPRVLATVDSLIAADPRAAIVVFSDHGGRHYGFSEHPEWRRNLVAVRGQLPIEIPLPARHVATSPGAAAGP